MVRIIAVWGIMALLLAAARLAAVYSLRHLEPHERTAMLRTCMHLHSQNRALCRQLFDDSHVIVNEKRSCHEAMTLRLQGSAWSMVKRLPPMLTCRAGPSRASYRCGGFCGG